MDVDFASLAKMIDHSLLQQTLTDAELEAGCRVALEYNTASVCIKPYYLRRCTEILAGSTVKPSTVIGFPHGGHKTAIKVAEAEAALDDGGQELDMVVNIGKVRSGDWQYVRDDIRAVNEATVARGQIVKVIFENCFLDTPQKIKLCEICGDLRVAFVKTSTGYGETGATIEDLKLMREHSPAWVQVKAAGGVRDCDKLLAVREIGVTRVGATATKAILDECRRRLTEMGK
jgi:deoxyribose-phosphate aldolase